MYAYLRASQTVRVFAGQNSLTALQHKKVFIICNSSIGSLMRSTLYVPGMEEGVNPSLVSAKM